MKQYKVAVSRLLFIAGALAWSPLVSAQESRTYEERFKVNPDVVVELSTSHADIEFETWNRNEVVVEATIELQGASEEEARAFFEKDGVEILGNSQKVQVRTQADRWAFRFSEPMDLHMEDLEIVMPEVPEVAPLVEELIKQVPEIAEMPPMPPLPPAPFDYEAYEKDGEKYMKEWQKKFEKEFDAEYREKFEAWGREMEARAKEMESQVKAREAERAEMQKALEKQREALAEQRAAIRWQAMKARDQARKAREQAREQARQSRVFFMRGPKGDRNFSIKKTIRIKMPKDARLQLNVRHGEVKLADNALNTKATLSYARLLATNIGGTATEIEARYTPVSVKSWKGGSLQADYSEAVSLSEVGQLNLRANSSEVTIDRLLDRATIDNRFGALHIENVERDFSDLAISVENGEVRCCLPQLAYRIQVKSDRSRIAYPEFIGWTEDINNGPTRLRKGYSQQKDSGRSIVINAAFSEVDLQK